MPTWVFKRMNSTALQWVWEQGAGYVRESGLMGKELRLVVCRSFLHHHLLCNPKHISYVP